MNCKDFKMFIQNSVNLAIFGKTTNLFQTSVIRNPNIFIIIEVRHNYFVILSNFYLIYSNHAFFNLYFTEEGPTAETFIKFSNVKSWFGFAFYTFILFNL